jgi:hypothetical protein
MRTDHSLPPYPGGQRRAPRCGQQRLPAPATSNGPDATIAANGITRPRADKATKETLAIRYSVSFVSLRPRRTQSGTTQTPPDCELGRLVDFDPGPHCTKSRKNRFLWNLWTLVMHRHLHYDRSMHLLELTKTVNRKRE